jgi:preprotein translocase subunit SecB
VSSSDLIPVAGYRLTKHSALELIYKVVAPDDEVVIQGEQRETKLVWDWRITGEDSFEVFMRGSVSPNESALDSVEVALLGEFEFERTRSVPIDSFIRIHAPAILFPFLRETIASLTGRGPYTAFYLPSVNVVELGSRYEFPKSTGAEQLRQSPALAERLGIAAETLSPVHG